MDFPASSALILSEIVYRIELLEYQFDLEKIAAAFLEKLDCSITPKAILDKEENLYR